MGPFEDLTKLKDLIPILVFLLPGFVSTGIVSLLVVRRPVEPFARVVEAVIFTTINLIVFAVLKRLLAHIPFLAIHSKSFFTAGNLALMGFCAVLVGLAWSYEANNQRLFAFLQRLRITIKTESLL
jgi:tetrahydromethanopterin S-methyltransferase subunit C